MKNITKRKFWFDKKKNLIKIYPLYICVIFQVCRVFHTSGGVTGRKGNGRVSVENKT